MISLPCITNNDARVARYVLLVEGVLCENGHDAAPARAAPWRVGLGLVSQRVVTTTPVTVVGRSTYRSESARCSIIFRTIHETKPAVRVVCVLMG